MWVRAHTWEHLELFHDRRILNWAEGIWGASGLTQRRRAIIFRSGGVELWFNERAKFNSGSTPTPRSASCNWSRRQLRRGLHGLWSPVPKPQKILDLAFPPAMILGRERIDTGIDADVANIELRTLDKVRYLTRGSSADAASQNCHRSTP